MPRIRAAVASPLLRTFASGIASAMRFAHHAIQPPTQFCYTTTGAFTNSEKSTRHLFKLRIERTTGKRLFVFRMIETQDSMGPNMKSPGLSLLMFASFGGDSRIREDYFGESGRESINWTTSNVTDDFSSNKS